MTQGIWEGGESSHSEGRGGLPVTAAGRRCFVIIGEEGLETVWILERQSGGRSCDLRKGGLATLKSGGGVLVTAEGASGPVTRVGG